MTLTDRVEEIVERTVSVDPKADEDTRNGMRGMLWAGVGIFISARFEAEQMDETVSPADYLDVLMRANKFIENMPTRD